MIQRRGISLITRVGCVIIALWLIMAHLGPMLALIVLSALIWRLR